VAVAQGELEVLALGLDTVAGAHDLDALGVALGDALDHVGDQGAGEAVQGAGLALVVGTGDGEGAVLERDGDRAGNGVLQLALRALDGDDVAVDLDLHTGRHRDGETSNT
jgi:hypothetical protein